MEVKRLRILGLNVFKTLNNLNPSYTNELFQKNSFQHKDLHVNLTKTSKYGAKNSQKRRTKALELFAHWELSF